MAFNKDLIDILKICTFYNLSKIDPNSTSNSIDKESNDSEPNLASFGLDETPHANLIAEIINFIVKVKFTYFY